MVSDKSRSLRPDDFGIAISIQIYDAAGSLRSTTLQNSSLLIHYGNSPDAVHDPFQSPYFGRQIFRVPAGQSHVNIDHEDYKPRGSSKTPPSIGIVIDPQLMQEGRREKAPQHVNTKYGSR